VILAKVVGSVVATQKVASMRGFKLLVVEPYRLHAEDRGSLVTTGRTLVAIDMLGAGEGELVMLTQGSSARLTPETKDLPIDSVVVGIVDSVHVGEVCAFNRQTAPNDRIQPKRK
jgi:ethanolamine utilization protein EutN